MILFTGDSPRNASLLEPRIAGGQRTRITEYPYLVSVQAFKLGHQCGGTLLSNYWVLTAGHCVTLDKTLYRIRAGSTFWEYGGQVVRVAKIIIHHYYRTSFHEYDNDIALVQLQEAVTSRKAKPIQLPNEDIRILNQNLTVLGWGSTSMLGGLSDEIRMINIPGHSYKSCKAIYNNEITKNMFCAGYLTKGTCVADAGGPAVAGNYLVGMTLFGRGCGKRYPGVYINVQRYISWIRHHTGLDI